MFKMLKQSKFEDIEVGKVFGIDGCFEIWYKVNKDKLMFLCGDWSLPWKEVGEEVSSMSLVTVDAIYPGEICNINSVMGYPLYKLPKNVQEQYVTN